MAEQQSTTEMVDVLHRQLKEGVDKCFVKKQRRKKSSEPPWMTDWIRDLISNRRTIFKTDEKRSLRWKQVKNRVRKIVRRRKKRFDDHILAKFEADTNPGNFFKHIDGLLGANTKPRWSPMDMYPSHKPLEAAEDLAAFFNAISSEYSPLDMSRVPSTHHRQLPMLSTEDVVLGMKKAKKPNSVVPGDIPPILYSRFPELLSVPARIVFNKITSTVDWPAQWKTEYVTVIPKNTSPTHASECRNISCTNFLSKLYETFVLKWSRDEVCPKLNQYGGEPGASASHLLVEVMDDITNIMEDNRMAATLSAIDFSKAFNRLSMNTA